MKLNGKYARLESRALLIHAMKGNWSDNFSQNNETAGSCLKAEGEEIFVP